MNVLLTALTSAAPTQGVQGVQNSPGTGTTQVPSILAALPPGTLLRGFVLNRDARGNPVLRTDSGDFLIQSDFFLKIGSDVVVRIDAMGKNFRASIISVDGQMPSKAESTPAHAEDADVITTTTTATPRERPATQESTTSATAPPAAPRTVATNVVTATVVRPNTPVNASPDTTGASPSFTAAPTSSAPASLPSYPAGSVLQLRVLTISAPPAVSAPLTTVSASPPSTPAPSTPAATPALSASTATVPAQGGVPVAAAPSTPSITAGTAQAAPASLPTSPLPTAPPAAPPVTTADPEAAHHYDAYRQTALATPGITTTATTSPAIPAALSTRPVNIEAVILPSPSPTETFVSTPVGMLRLAQPLSFAPGTVLKLEINAATQADTPIAPVNTPAALLNLAAGWATMQQAMATLEQSGDDATLALLKNALPQFTTHTGPSLSGPNTVQQMASALPAFMAALTSGDFRSWVGARVAKALEERGGAELLRRAEGEFQAMRALFTETPPTQWQSLFLPVMADGELKQLRFYTKRERKKQERGKPAEADTRFVVEMDFTQLGPLQLDGFVKKREGKTQFDLIVRTHVSLDDESKNDIQRIFSITGDATGYTGMVLFQQGTVFPVQPLEDILKDTHRDVMV